ncbi:MAG: ATP-NAD kinase [Gammaproteobacteria bacterium]|nr:ATP-NAD kinase [Gammaproteobacteria bacterium]MYB36549.1 ATP-NAD kinase [Gammaproteobacteria bacterium]
MSLPQQAATRVVGIVANPASGKDVRRLTARASVFDNQEKAAIVRRCLAGIAAQRRRGQTSQEDSRTAVLVRYLPDSHNIVASAAEETGIAATPLDIEASGTAADTRAAAEALKGAATVITLGGDGTNRAFAQGWLDAPLIPLSTGTNNAFPHMQEATAAGVAAGLVASGGVPLAAVSERAKVIHVAIEAEPDDLALIDAVATTDRFLGARAIVDPRTWIMAVLTRADPAAVGMTGVAGFALPLAASCDGGVLIEFAADERPATRVLHAPVAPGHFADVAVAATRNVALNAPVHLQGPATLAFDGERERTLKPGQRATFTMRRDGPHVISVRRALAHAARAGRLSVERGALSAGEREGPPLARGARPAHPTPSNSTGD